MESKVFENELRIRESNIKRYLLASRQLNEFRPRHIRDLALAYINRPAKRLRPAALLFACGAAAQSEDSAIESRAIPAAAGIELVHTWTLTHDDLIDHDEKRRGEATVHQQAAERARNEFHYNGEASAEYGQRVAILVGDAQHAWSIALFMETPSPPVDPRVTAKIVSLLESRVVPQLIYGETLDVQYERRDIASLLEEDIVNMLRLKTGVLYQFAATAGAMLGLNCTDPSDKVVQALAKFAGHCGTAFQLWDDILGIVGDETTLGKPVGSDIREGKRTTVLQHSLSNAKPWERRFLNSVLGNHSASEGDIRDATELLVSRGGIDYTKDLAGRYIGRAMPYLKKIPSSRYRDLLQAWAQHMIERTY